MKITGVNRCGYSENMGGVSFMLSVEEVPGRVEKLEENESYVLNFLVEDKEFGGEIRANLCAASVSSNGEVSHWGLDRDREENEITEQEMEQIMSECKELGVLSVVSYVSTKYRELYKEYMDPKNWDLKTAYEKPENPTLEDFIESDKRVKALKLNRDILSQKMKELELFDFQEVYLNIKK